MYTVCSGTPAFTILPIHKTHESQPESHAAYQRNRECVQDIASEWIIKELCNQD